MLNPLCSKYFCKQWGPDEMQQNIRSTLFVKAKKILKKIEMCPWDTDAPAFAKFAKKWIFINKGYNSWRHDAIWSILHFEEDIMVLNNVTKFHKILMKTIWLRELTSLPTVNLHKQRAIITEHMVWYKPLSNLKKISWYLTMWPSFIKFWSKLFNLESRHCFKRWIFINKGP